MAQDVYVCDIQHIPRLPSIVALCSPDVARCKLDQASERESRPGTGNAADKFIQIDDYVRKRLRSLLIKRKGRHLRAGEAEHCTRAWF